MVRIETFPLQIIQAFYKSFRNIEPMRVLMKIAKPELLPPGLPSNVLTQTWFPQIQILSNIYHFFIHSPIKNQARAAKLSYIMEYSIKLLTSLLTY